MVLVFRDLNLATLQKTVQFVQEFKPNTDCYHSQSSGKENALNAIPVKDILLSFLVQATVACLHFQKKLCEMFHVQSQTFSEV